MKPFAVAVAGLGTVGGGAVHLLQENAELIAARAGRPLVIGAVSARDSKKKRSVDISHVEWTDDPLAWAERPDIDAVVETIGGADGIARRLCEKALAAGKPVVTANKAMLAAHGYELALLAEAQRAPLLFEAAVGGGLPVIKTLREALAGNRILSVRGILNGTCNYILTRMRDDGLSFADALARAQKLGYAEADPAADIEGHDTAHKIAILAALAFGARPDLKAVTLEGLTRLTPADFKFAEELGCRIKLLGLARRTEKGIEQRVEPCLVPLSSRLSGVDDVLNAVEIEGDAVGTLTLIGRGAGSDATASAVVGDLIDLARGAAPYVWGIPAQQLTVGKPLPLPEKRGRFYLRLDVADRAGVLAEISALFRDEGLSVESLLQHGSAVEEKELPIAVVLHEAAEEALRRAEERISKLGAVRGRPLIVKMC